MANDTAAHPGDEILRIRKALQTVGMTQFELANKLGWPASAVSNLLNGKRRLKVEEAGHIDEILGLSDQGQIQRSPIPVVFADDLVDPERAVAQSHSVLGFETQEFGGSLVAYIARRTNSVTSTEMSFYCIFDPAVRELFDNAPYVIRFQSSTRLMTYHSDPARFEPLWDPREDGGAILLGSQPFHVIGQMRSIGMRPEVDLLLSN